MPETNDPIVIKIDNADRVRNGSEISIKIGPDVEIKKNFHLLEQRKQEAQRLLTPDIQQMMRNLAGFGHNGLKPDQRLKPELERLAALEIDQYDLMRAIVGDTINRYGDSNQIPKSSMVNVCWAGGHDQFTTGMRGYWKYVGLEGEINPDVEVAVPGIAQFVYFDVFKSGLHLPRGINSGSVAVSLFKTPGMDGALSEPMWPKIHEAASKNGLVILGDEDIPDKYKEYYQPASVLMDLINTNKISMVNPHAYTKLYGGYVANEFSFWSKKP